MIKLIKKINVEKLIFLTIMLLLIGTPTLTLLRYTCLRFDFDFPPLVSRAYLLWGTLPIMFIFYILDIVLNKKKITLIDILMYLLIILAVISTKYSINTVTSMYGEHARNEGLLSILSYYFIFLNIKNMSNEKYKNTIIKTIIILGIVQIIYSILQVYTKLPFILHYNAPYIAFGLSGNPNFLGSYMVILTSFTFTTYILQRKKLYLILSIIFFIGLCLCNSTGPLLSFILVIIFFTIVYRKRIKWKNLLTTICLFVISYLFINYSVSFVQTKILNNNVNVNYQISSVKNDLSLSDFGNGRVKLWKDSLPFLKDYWAIGSGLDTFGILYGVRNGRYYDKAHNVYLQIAITNGIFALIIYLSILSIIFFKGLKIRDPFYISLFMAFIGYSIQAFANISVIEIAPTFFAVCGLLLGKKQ